MDLIHHFFRTANIKALCRYLIVFKQLPLLNLSIVLYNWPWAFPRPIAHCRGTIEFPGYSNCPLLSKIVQNILPNTNSLRCTCWNRPSNSMVINIVNTAFDLWNWLFGVPCSASECHHLLINFTNHYSVTNHEISIQSTFGICANPWYVSNVEISLGILS